MSDVPKELKLLGKWQKILHLDDWFISLIYPCDKDKMPENSDGCVSYEEVLKAAEIKIINPEQRGESFYAFNFEETLVHELLHLKFCLLEQGDDWDKDLQLRILHQTIDDFSKILVRLKENGTSN